jgi:hypothetical protein
MQISLPKPRRGNMTKVEEVHDLSVVIPVFGNKFNDDKEIGELFDYVYKLSKIHNFEHYPNTFIKTFERGEDVFRFTISISENNAETIPDRKKDLEELVEIYNKIEAEYFRFRKFGDIESRMLIRKGPK